MGIGRSAVGILFHTSHALAAGGGRIVFVRVLDWVVSIIVAVRPTISTIIIAISFGVGLGAGSPTFPCSAFGFFGADMIITTRAFVGDGISGNAVFFAGES